MNRFQLCTLITAILFGPLFQSDAQELGVHPQSTAYLWPEDGQVLAKLEKWQDQKFGMIIHWGLYSEAGITESWPLCSESWITRPEGYSYCEFKDWYWGLNQKFNPTEFDPDQWAEAAKGAGMKYLVFTTKHHDGFCLFDTKETDFSITQGAFRDHPKADVTKYVFDAFRKRDFMIGAYYSKPDWHCPDYWWPRNATANRNNNYDIRKYPEKWESYKAFTHAQIDELMTNYGDVDILWLDGGWVRPRETVTEEVLSWGAPIPEWSQDIDMEKVAQQARKKQSGLLVVDRTVHGAQENYQTPEGRIPKTRLDYPWESCIPLGNNWGYVPTDKFKTAEQVIRDLVEIVAKGGNLLLGIGPKPDGTLSQVVLERLSIIGDYLRPIAPAIFETRSVEQYRDGQTFFTQDKSGQYTYAIHLLDREENEPINTVSWKGPLPRKGSKMTLVSDSRKLDYTIEDERVVIRLNKKMAEDVKKYPAFAIRYESEN